MKIVISNDHTAVDYKFKIKEYIESLGHEVIDVGIGQVERCDYPDYAYKGCKKIVDKEADLGVLICGTGVGMCISANKVKGIRACVCSDTYTARLCREHNDANVICFGERVVGLELAKDIVKEFLNAKFQNAQHTARVQKIMEIEKGNLG